MSGSSIALIFISLLFFVCFATGSVILNFFKIQKKQVSSKMIIGLFGLFSFVSMIAFVLELFSAFITLQIYIYLLWGSVLVFSLIPIIFVKYWFKSFKLNWNSLILILLFIGFFLYFYFSLDIDIVKSGVADKLNGIDKFMTQISPEILRDVFDQIMLAPLVIFNINHGVHDLVQHGDVYQQYVFMFNVSIKSLMFTALSAMIIENNIGKTFVGKLINSIVISAGVFGIVALTTNLEISINAQSTYVYLIMLILIMLAFYCTNQNRYKMYTYLLGLLTISVIGLDKSKILILLFFIYAILLILSFSFDNMLIKDHIKILFPVSVGLLLYSLTTMNITWIVVSLVMLVFSLALVIWIFSSHVLIKQMEFTLSKRSSILMIVVPVVVIGIGVLMFLGVPEWNNEMIDEKFGYLVKFELFSNIEDPLTSLPIFISITGFELIICFLWISRRKKFNSKFSVILVDFVVIQYLMFYNPFSISFWRVILSEKEMLQFAIFDLFYVVLIFATLMWLLEKAEKYIIKLLKVNTNEDEEITVVIYKNVFKRIEEKANEWKNKIKDRRTKKQDKRLEP